MRFQVLTLLCATQLALVSASQHGKVLHRRQNPAPASSSSSSSSSSTSTSGSAGPAATTTGAPGVPGVTTVTSTSVTVVTPPLASGATATNAPPLASITMGMPTQATLAISSTYAKGATPPISGAPHLPTPFVFQMSDWPPQDHVPDTNSPEVQEWMKELDGFNIPDFSPTADGSCAGDPTAASQAQQRGWWTCGGWTRDTDITACPDKGTWGVSFDDGPGPYTQNVLDYLKGKNIHATFFVVGSRVIERPKVLVEEYMAGHEISVHTWSHRVCFSLVLLS
ncbi:hypothetical protein NP233_g11486 [Leucocoprinus birnbaumii]|uniref:chitin deacetylase n=1 Tax=Leucocoprinus birnbaumii TaxID=56174 RepID=A0AAD5YL89_9AGAR|nr:hypothetical protein NP233_g11486 [Leucocoprinus birnbaumii]